MSDTLYPIFYGTRLVTWDVLVNTFEPNMHPEAARRGFNFMHHQGGKFGIGGGFRALGTQPDRPGFATEGRSFHQPQDFPSGMFYTAWDVVVVNPGYKHRSPRWNEVPEQGGELSRQYGYHMNVSSEAWHGQPIELDGWWGWVNAGRKDLLPDYPITINSPRPQPPQPPTPPPTEQPPTEGIMVQVQSRYLKEGAVGPDVKFFQGQMNDLAGQGLLLDGHYGGKTVQAVKNWQTFFNLYVDGECGPKTQQSIFEIGLQV